MLEAWKRKEALIALKRGMSDADTHSADRPGTFDCCGYNYADVARNFVTAS
jgi:hypothetical protein